MRIILDGTEAELKDVLRSFGELREELKNIVKEFSAESNAPAKPEALNDVLKSSEVDIDLNAMAENASKLKL